MINILARVEVAMSTDTEDQQDQSDRIADQYRRATPEQREMIDQVFICLCGYALKTILAGEDRG